MATTLDAARAQYTLSLREMWHGIPVTGRTVMAEGINYGSTAAVMRFLDMYAQPHSDIHTTHFIGQEEVKALCRDGCCEVLQW